MEITWLGTAGFRIRAGGASILIDPYLTRNPGAIPRQPLTPEDLGPADAILVSHGHFDHILDVPAIARHTGARVFCSTIVARTLKGTHILKGNRIFGVRGLAKDRLAKDQIRIIEKDRTTLHIKGIRATAFFSRHVRFDARLLVTTLARVAPGIGRILPLILGFPCGQVLSWRLRAENKILHFFGSAGSGKAELQALAASPPDILLVPLQGHSDICDLAFRYVEILRPGMVIPHHQDDFYPPLSQTVDIQPFVDRVSTCFPRTRVRVMGINDTLLF